MVRCGKKHIETDHVFAKGDRTRILFVSSLQVYCSVEKPLYDQNAITLGVSHVSPFRKQEGHETRMIMMTRDTPKEVLDNAIEEFKPGLIGFTSVNIGLESGSPRVHKEVLRRN